MQLYVQAAENMLIKFFLFFFISGLSFQIIPALYKCDSFLTVKPEYILCGYVLSKKFHRQM